MIVYGIKNCDSVKKAIKYLNDKNIEFEFFDFKTHKMESNILNDAISQIGVGRLVNKRSTTYRNLDDEIKDKIEKSEGVIEVLIENPTLIKRPLIFHKSNYYCGFNKQDFDDNF